MKKQTSCNVKKKVLTCWCERKGRHCWDRKKKKLLNYCASTLSASVPLFWASSPNSFCYCTQIPKKYFSLYSHATPCPLVFDPCRHPCTPTGGKWVLSQLLVQILAQTVRGLLGRGHTLGRYLLLSLTLTSSPTQLNYSHFGMEGALVQHINML